jgi:nicotinate dehydrogenase subunit B
LTRLVRLAPSRRDLLRGAGALVLGFSISHSLAQGVDEPRGRGEDLPGSLNKSPLLDSWIRVDADGTVTVFTGKAELGQGIKTALLQVAAEEIEVPLDALRLVTADTGRTSDEEYTAGSHSMQDSGTAIRNAAAQVREILIGEAARRLGVSPDRLSARQGSVVAPDGRRIGYGELVAGNLLHVEAQAHSRLKDAAKLSVIGQSVPRVDIPAKVTGGAAYVQDLRLPGMVHARVVRPPSYRARLVAVDTGAVEKMPGVMLVRRDGNFLAVVASREFQAVRAMRALSAAARWYEQPSLPQQQNIAEFITGLPSEEIVILDGASPGRGPALTMEATYTRPYQCHGSIGPSCAVAQLRDGQMTVWTHTQGVYPDRNAIAELLRMPKEQVRCIHVEGSGCYGHNGADDAAADAALIAQALPGVPVRVQWTREQEHGWEPFGPAMVAKTRAALDSSGTIVDWEYHVWSNTHATRPGPAGALLAARHLAGPFSQPKPKPLPQPEGGGDRNAVPLYRLPGAKVVHHFIPEMPLRVSALRSLGAYCNVFAIESFMDEVARAADADPVEFRLKHLDDARARDVITAAAERFGWARRQQVPRGRGAGFAFARYKNLAGYCAVAVEIEIERETGRARVVRAVAAVDVGQVVNPDGLRNQIEGAILQSTSWTLYESVNFDETRITSIDWSTYPILRFDAVPDEVEVHILDRPGLPFLGGGEIGQGPTAAAIANAVAHATGQRLRDLPFTRERIKAAIGV